MKVIGSNELFVCQISQIDLAFIWQFNFPSNFFNSSTIQQTGKNCARWLLRIFNLWQFGKPSAEINWIWTKTWLLTFGNSCPQIAPFLDPLSKISPCTQIKWHDVLLNIGIPHTLGWKVLERNWKVSSLLPVGTKRNLYETDLDKVTRWAAA